MLRKNNCYIIFTSIPLEKTYIYIYIYIYIYMYIYLYSYFHIYNLFEKSLKNALELVNLNLAIFIDINFLKKRSHFIITQLSVQSLTRLGQNALGLC